MLENNYNSYGGLHDLFLRVGNGMFLEVVLYSSRKGVYIMLNEKKEERHESYGSISAARFNGGCTSFYGSKIPHDRGIELCINTGYSCRDLNTEWFYEGKNLITVRMTEMQFAELITGLNSNRVPCTLVNFNGKMMENPPMKENERQTFTREFGEHFQDVSKQVRDMKARMTELLEKKSLSKADKQELLKMADHLAMKVDANTPYIQKSFEESMDKVVQEAKVDIQTYCYERQRTALAMDSQAADDVIKHIEAGSDATTIDAEDVRVEQTEEE